MYASTDVAKNVYVVDHKLGGGKLSLSACPGVGNRPPGKKNIANPQGCAWGGWLQVKLLHAYHNSRFSFVCDTSQQQTMLRRERAP